MNTLYRFPSVVEELYKMAESAARDSRYCAHADADLWPFEVVDKTLACLERQPALQGDVSEQEYRKNAVRLFWYILPLHRNKEASREIQRTGGDMVRLDALPPTFSDPVDETVERRPDRALLKITRKDIIQALRRGNIDEWDLRIFIWRVIDKNSWSEIAEALPTPHSIAALQQRGMRLRRRWGSYLRAYFYPVDP